jgi:hypothetical protein
MMPTSAASVRTLHCVASAGTSVAVFASTFCFTASDNGGVPGGRVLSRSKPSTPSSMYRSCQRQTHGFNLSVSFMIALVQSPSAVARMIFARHTALLALLQSAMTASRRARLVGLT